MYTQIKGKGETVSGRGKQRKLAADITQNLDLDTKSKLDLGRLKFQDSWTYLERSSLLPWERWTRGSEGWEGTRWEKTN